MPKAIHARKGNSLRGGVRFLQTVTYLMKTGNCIGWCFVFLSLSGSFDEKSDEIFVKYENIPQMLWTNGA